MGSMDHPSLVLENDFSVERIWKVGAWLQFDSQFQGLLSCFWAPTPPKTNAPTVIPSFNHRPPLQKRPPYSNPPNTASKVFASIWDIVAGLMLQKREQQNSATMLGVTRPITITLYNHRTCAAQGHDVPNGSWKRGKPRSVGQLVPCNKCPRTS